MFAKVSLVLLAFGLVVSMASAMPSEGVAQMAQRLMKRHALFVDSSMPPTTPDPFMLPPHKLNHSMDQNQYAAMMAMMQKIELPLGFSRLMFNTTERLTVGSIMSNVSRLYPRTNGTDDYACVNRCMLEEQNITTYSCEDMQKAEQCVVKCDHSQYTQFLQKALKENMPYVCPEGNESKQRQKELEHQLQACVVTLQNSSFVTWVKMARKSVDCYMDLEESRDNQHTCKVLERCLAEKDLYELCPQLKDKKSLLQSRSVIVLTYLSDGRLPQECPQLYKD
jgi:hypothetical protein